MTLKLHIDMYNLSEQALFRKVYTDNDFLYRTNPETGKVDQLVWIRKRKIPDYILKIIKKNNITVVGLTYIYLNENKDSAIYYQKRCSFFDDTRQRSYKLNKLYSDMFVNTGKEDLLDKRLMKICPSVDVRVNVETGEYDQFWYPVDKNIIRKLLPESERNYYDTIAKNVKAICYKKEKQNISINIAYETNYGDEVNG